MSNFSSFGFITEIESFLKEASLKTPTEVQSKSMTPLIKGESVSVLAQTGSGKTLAYALPLFHRLKLTDDNIEMDEQFGAPRAIIVTPTRELNQQVFKVMKSVAHHAKLRVRTLVGGDKGKRSRQMNEDAFDILVTSPGRLLSALERKEVSPKLLELMVFDEADQLLDMGFSKDIKKIQEQIFEVNRAAIPQVALFSATWPAQYQNFVSEVFANNQFKEVICQGGVQLKRNIETFNIYLGPKEKERLLEEFLKGEAKGTGVIFVNRKEDAVTLTTFIRETYKKKKVYELHGNQLPKERKDAMATFREKGGILVATDIAARGIDITDLSWVLNYDLPFEAVYYIHRCGRTGRAGRQGKVYNFVTSADLNLMVRINEAILNQSSLALKTLEPPKGSRPLQLKTHKKTKKKVAGPVKKKHTKKSAVRRKTPRYKKK